MKGAAHTYMCMQRDIILLCIQDSVAFGNPEKKSHDALAIREQHSQETSWLLQCTVLYTGPALRSHFGSSLCLLAQHKCLPIRVKRDNE